MSTLSHQRCFHHSLREAVARCPECRQFYCRECITEHDDRVICASCLSRLATSGSKKTSNWEWFGVSVSCVIGLVIAFLIFYELGEALLLIPSNFHEGNVWTERWLDQQ